MNLFRPYQMGEPQRDARGRLVGIDRYQDVLGRNWKRFFLTGLLTLLGCLPLALGVGAVAFAGMMLFFWSAVRPTLATVLLYLFSCLLFLVLSTLYWTQLVLFDQRAGVRLRNGLLFVLRYFWVTLGTGLLQLAWWVLMVLFAPWTLLLMPFVGSWFVLFAALFLLYDRLDQAFAIEESISRAFPEQARHEER